MILMVILCIATKQLYEYIIATPNTRKRGLVNGMPNNNNNYGRYSNRRVDNVTICVRPTIIRLGVFTSDER